MAVLSSGGSLVCTPVLLEGTGHPAREGQKSGGVFQVLLNHPALVCSPGNELPKSEFVLRAFEVNTWTMLKIRL